MLLNRVNFWLSLNSLTILWVGYMVGLVYFLFFILFFLFKSFLFTSDFFFKQKKINIIKINQFPKNFLKKLEIFSFFDFFSISCILKKERKFSKFFFKFIYFFFFFKFLRLYSFLLLDFFKVILKFLGKIFSFFLFFFFFEKNYFSQKYFLFLKLRNFFSDYFVQNNQEKTFNNLNFFLKLGLLKTFNENFFITNFKQSKPLLLRNKLFNFVKISENFFFKFFFSKENVFKNDSFFRNSLFFFFKIFFNRRLFSRSIFWFIWKNSQLFRYFYFFLRNTTYFFRIKLLFYLKGLHKNFMFSFYEKRDFFFFLYLWCFFIFKFRGLFLKFKQRLSCFLKNSFFFRKSLNFFDFDFYNKLFFDFNFNGSNSAMILSFGRRYFFSKFFAKHITVNTYIFFKKYGFLHPFGFVGFLRKMMHLSFNLWLKDSRFLFEGDSENFYLKKKNSDLKLKRFEDRSKMSEDFFNWKRLFRRVLNFSKKFRHMKYNVHNIFLKPRFPNYMSKFFYKKIFIYKYKLFLYFKSKLSMKFQVFFNFLKFIYDPFICNLKIALLAKTKFIRKEFLKKFPNVFWHKILHYICKRSFFSSYSFTNRFVFLFKLYDFFGFKHLKFQHLFFKKQLFFYNNFFKNNFFFSLLGNFFKQLSFLVIPSSFHKLRKKQVYVFSTFVFFDIDILVSLIKRFRFSQFDYFWVEKVPFLHVDSSLVLEKTNRIFLLYLKLRKFLIQYWRLKFKIFFTRYVWKTNKKIFVYLLRFSEFIAKIYVKKTSTNYIVTLTDLFGKVLFTCTSFSSLTQKREDKRRRLSFFALEDMVSKFVPYLFLYDVTMLILISRIRTKMVFRTFFKHLGFFGLKWFGSIREFLNPHNGVRGRKIRRR